MTESEILIVKHLKERGFMFRPSKSADFIDRLYEKEQPEAYELSESQRAWLFALLHRYRSKVPDVHFQHCKDKKCQHEMRSKVKRQLTQLCLF